MDNRPIGVFDSGIGGLTVLQEIIEKLPGEDIIYFGDTARIPYGTRSKETVIEYVFQCIEFLMNKNVKAVVIACNTATAHALEEAKINFNIPIIGVIEPGAKEVVSTTKNNKIGVIGTSGTIDSQSYQKKIGRLLPSAEVTGVSCPLFVPIVEEGWQDTEVAFIVAEKYLEEFKEHGIDALVLGCTHYPMLKYTISKVIGKGVTLVNPAYETAEATKNLLKEHNLCSENIDGGKYEFYVSDAPEKFRRLGGNFLRKEIKSVEKVNL